MYRFRGKLFYLYYNGRILTMTSGTMAGRSTRIVGYSPTAATLRVVSFEGSFVPALTNQSFVINGRPFNGVGFGYNANGLINAKDNNGRLFALLPNPKYPSMQGSFTDLGDYQTAYKYPCVSTYGISKRATAMANLPWRR